MPSIKVWIDQLLEKITEENEHYHLGKLKWLLKFRKYKHSQEELFSTQDNHEVIKDAANNSVIIDKSLPSSAPTGSTMIKRLLKKGKRKFLSPKNKSRGA